MIVLTWHVAQTQPFQGQVAERYLLEGKENGRLEFEEVFNPKVKVTRKWSRGREEETVQPYIPGYIFIRFDTEEQNWRPINWTFGIKTVMYSTEEIPARIREDAMAPLLAICVGGYLIQEDADKELWKIGRRVKITEGSFEGWEGPIAWTSGKRLGVMMEIFGTKRDVEVKRKNVELVF